MTSSDDTDGNVAETPGSLPQEEVEDRPNVGTVKPEDYPDAKVGRTDGGGSARPAGRDDQMEDERLNPGNSAGSTGSGKEQDQAGKAGRARQPFNGGEAHGIHYGSVEDAGVLRSLYSPVSSLPRIGLRVVTTP